MAKTSLANILSYSELIIWLERIPDCSQMTLSPSRYIEWLSASYD